MADWDYVVRRNASDTSTLPTTGSTLDHDWDTSVLSQGSAITYSAGTFTLVDTGKYLVMVSDHFGTTSTTNNERINWMTYLRLNGANIVPGQASGYIRKSGGSQEYITYGCGIIHVSSASQSLVIRSDRSDNSTTGSPTRQNGDRSGISILKIADGNNFGRYSQSTNTAAASGNGTEADIAWDTTDEEEGPFTRTGNSIDIDTAGRYFVSYSVPMDGSGSIVRSEFTSHLELNGTEVPGTRDQTYIRTTDNTDDGCLSWGGIIDVAANDDLVLRHTRHDGETFTINYLAGSCIQIWQLPSGNETCIVSNTTGNFNTSATDFVWGATADHIDTAGFTYGGSAANVDVDVTDQYLVFATTARTSLIAATRAVPAIQLRVNTTDQEMTGGSSYNRNSGAGVAGITCGALLDLTANDSVYARNDRIGTVTTAMAAQQASMSLLRLGSITSGDVTISPGADSLAVSPQVPTWAGQNGASYLAALNIDVNIDVTSGNVNKRVIYEFQNDGSSLTPTIKYRYSKNSGAYADIGTASSDIRLYNSSNLTDGDDSVQVIGSGTFVSNNNAIVDATDGSFTSDAIASSSVIESELSFELVAADLSDGDTIDIDAFFSDNTQVGPVTQSARITITAGAPDTQVDVGTDTLTVTPNVPANVASGVNVSPGADSLAVSPQTPVAASGARVDPGADSLVVSDQTPQYASGGGSSNPPADSLSVAPNAPSISTGVTVSPGADSLTVTPNAPVAASGVSVSPSNDSLTVTPEVPRVLIPIKITLGNADSLVVSPNAPTTASGVNVSPSNDSLTVSPNVPEARTGVRVEPGNDSLTVTPNAPSVEIGVNISGITDTLTVTTNSPTANSGASVSPNADSLVVSPNAPEARTGVRVNSGVDSLTVVPNAPETRTGVRIDAPVDSLSVSPQVPVAASGVMVSLGGPDSFAVTPNVPVITAQDGDVEINVPADSLIVNHDIPVVGSGVKINVPLHELGGGSAGTLWNGPWM